MNPEQNDSGAEQRDHSPFIFGHHIILDGGEEDTTIRPSRYPFRTMSGPDQQRSTASEATGGPDLIDWLNRVFD